jgi:hypothetical protein
MTPGATTFVHHTCLTFPSPISTPLSVLFLQGDYHFISFRWHESASTAELQDVAWKRILLPFAAGILASNKQQKNPQLCVLKPSESLTISICTSDDHCSAQQQQHAQSTPLGQIPRGHCTPETVRLLRGVKKTLEERVTAHWA